MWCCYERTVRPNFPFVMCRTEKLLMSSKWVGGWEGKPHWRLDSNTGLQWHILFNANTQTRHSAHLQEIWSAYCLLWEDAFPHQAEMLYHRIKLARLLATANAMSQPDFSVHLSPFLESFTHTHPRRQLSDSRLRAANSSRSWSTWIVA